MTLLYPSRLEQRLILGLLGPLAVLSAAMEMVPLHQSQTVIDIADTIRNTCNATLSLLFTAALILWGFVVNRRQAWRTDGGTAAFGTAAMILTIVSTALNFLYIPAKNQYLWLPSLIWSLVLWQSFLGWWWWVGGGQGVGEIEELLQREERRYKKRQARAMRRAVRKEKAQALWRNASESLGLARRPSARVAAGARPEVSPDGVASEPRVNVERDDSSVTASTQPQRFSRIRSARPIVMLSQFYHILRLAHLAAAHSQALEWMRRRRLAFGTESSEGMSGSGWGLGSFGLRERQGRRDNAQATLGDDGENSKESEHQMASTSPPSIWWVRPLRQMRLQDRTVYH